MQEIRLWLIRGQVLISNRSHRASIIRWTCFFGLLWYLSNHLVREATINKVFAKLVGKHLCCSHSLTKLQVCSPQLYKNRTFGRGIFILYILRNFSKQPALAIVSFVKHSEPEIFYKKGVLRNITNSVENACARVSSGRGIFL